MSQYYYKYSFDSEPTIGLLSTFWELLHHRNENNKSDITDQQEESHMVTKPQFCDCDN